MSDRRAQPPAGGSSESPAAPRSALSAHTRARAEATSAATWSRQEAPLDGRMGRAQFFSCVPQNDKRPVFGV